MPPKQPCRYYNTSRGCSNGDSCRFTHEINNVSPGTNSATKPAKSRPANISFQDLQAPRGVCRFHYNNIYCKNAMNCGFRHERPATSTPTQGDPSLSYSTTINAIAPFLTPEGIAKIRQTGTDAFFQNSSQPMTMGQAQPYLQKFTKDGYQPRLPDLHAFAKILDSVNVLSWRSDDAQLFLNTVATGNGLSLINAALSWQTVSARSSNSTTMSFQRGYLPILKFLTSESVLKNNLSQLINGLFSVFLNNMENFATQVECCIEDCLSRNTFRDPMRMSEKGPSGSQVFVCLSAVLFECLKRWKNATITYPRLAPLIRKLHEWLNTWADKILQTPSTFDDPLIVEAPSANRQHVVNHLKGKIQQLVDIVEREESKNNLSALKSATSRTNVESNAREGVVAMMMVEYEGPGELRSNGPRHDNDFADISEIRVAPTHEELVCRTSPFLPGNFYEAPHHLEPGSMARLLDIQFRLLREELTAPLRKAVQLCIDDLQTGKKKVRTTRLGELMEKKGGKYRGYSDGQDSLLFNVYTGAQFVSLVPDRRGLSVSMMLDAPAGRARSAQSSVRVRFWEGASGKRLMQGGLIALVWKQEDSVSVHLGTVSSPSKDIVASAKQSAEQILLRVSFFDAAVELRILNTLKHNYHSTGEVRFLVESPVMYEAIRPFLEVLKELPEEIPFGHYLSFKPYSGLQNIPKVDPPRYATIPGFSYQLSSLFTSDAEVAPLVLHPSDPTSIENCRRELKHSRLDASQADAVVDALTREVALIQGPPGTGKSYTGVELLRVLFANDIGPVLMIAFTNHALDHLLNSILDAKIAKKIVRLGSRSSDERISKFSLETLETVSEKGNSQRVFAQHYRALKQAQEDMKGLLDSFTRAPVSPADLRQHMDILYTEHYNELLAPPDWIAVLLSLSDMAQFQKVKKSRKDEEIDDPQLAFWLNGEELDFLAGCHKHLAALPNTARAEETNTSSANPFALLANEDTAEEEEVEELTDEVGRLVVDDTEISLEPWATAQWITKSTAPTAPIPNEMPQELSPSLTGQAEELSPSSKQLEVSDFQNPVAFLHAMGLDTIPPVPTSRRAASELSSPENSQLWQMSLIERKALYKFWVDEVRVTKYAQHLQEFERLREQLSEAIRNEADARDESRRQLLKNVDIIGCTTTGAAKLISLLKTVAPKVMLVEEAGQVLEAHILGTLVPSIEHLILIGDPLQLRPTLNNYTLSVDSRKGKELYQFDRSLMERLSATGFPMSQINVQRRMRPSISKLIRKTLYPHLVDNERVLSYPDVRGFAKNVFFFSHQNRENGGDDSSSKYNDFEVEMIKDLVLYLLRQGVYSREGDIVVLCAYLGQLARMRDALSKEMAVVIDERDQADLADLESEESEVQPIPERVQVSRRIKLRTIDNFQGEEAKIIILSLVRNNGAGLDDIGDERSRIGFLKSVNRANVGLSRAMEGLFILGNATQLSKHSPMWRGVIQDLTEDESVGDAIPVRCHMHPSRIEYISKPGQLSQFAPDGGCLQQCDMRLGCGHLCPYKCHPDDKNHLGVQCNQPCRRLCPREHPCNKRCSSDCGQCMFVVQDLQLPCGHIKESVFCYELDDLSTVPCSTVISKSYADCEHSVDVECSVDVTSRPCTNLCGGIMSCCGRDCNSRCGDCKSLNAGALADGNTRRIQHKTHPCQKILYCGHNCGKDCSQNHTHTQECNAPCRQQCSHASCKFTCSTPCAPCQEPCTWTCAHADCPVPCGSACIRLPCDKRCNTMLSCGHRCPSVCGEDCAIQHCPICLPTEDIVDLIMQTPLKDICSQDTLDQLLITLPRCGHTFTVETLDGICAIDDYYERPTSHGEPTGTWTNLKYPPTNQQSPPLCPTCRAVITSPRYGRIFKRANLDILERDVASSMAKSLASIHNSKAKWDKGQLKDRLTSKAKGLQIPRHQKAGLTGPRILARDRLLKALRTFPVAFEALDPANTKFHGIPPIAASEWKKIVKVVLATYKAALETALQRSAHMNAWESAFSCLFDYEMQTSLRQSVTPNSQEALLRAKRLAGPAPMADKRFVVEAIWASLELRIILAELVQAWLEGASENASFDNEARVDWASYGMFILHTAQVDARLALDISTRSQSRRRMTKSVLWGMRTDLELFRFNVEVYRLSGMLKNSEYRKKLIQEAEGAHNLLVASINQTIQEHLAILKSGADESAWLNENFMGSAHLIGDEWCSILRSLRMETRYEPVSLQEKIDIVKAFDFSHTGHFYQCENGHPFVIGECGGAMQASRCPECHSPVGGTSHTLHSSNTPATELESLASHSGAQPSPWEWARG